MKGLRIMALVLGFCLGIQLMADSQMPEPLPTFVEDPCHGQDRFLDSRQRDAELLFIGRDIPIRSSKGKTLPEQGLYLTRGDDFLVNDDTTHGCSQSYPRIARNRAGSFVVCWEDLRDGINDVWVQRFDAAGNPQDTAFRVNDDAAYIAHPYPGVGIDDLGNFVVCWYDRGEDIDIWAQRYDAAGNPLGGNFRVSDDPGENYQMYPAMAMDPAGNFVITWYDDRNGNYDIYAQQYDDAGNPVGANFLVNDDGGTSLQTRPWVAMNQSGNFTIAWTDYRNGNYDIYAQRYDAAGNPVGVNFQANDDVGTQAQYNPSVAMDTLGDFVISWYDRRNAHYDIYAQRYDTAGTPIDSNFLVNDDVGTYAQYYPRTAMGVAGDFVITWYDDRSGNNDIWAQRYDAAGDPLGVNYKVNDDLGTASQYLPDIAIDSSGNYIITWYDYRFDSDIYAQMYDADGNPQHPNNLKVNADMGTCTQYYATAAMDTASNFVVCFYDSRDGAAYDVWIQRYDAAGNALGVNFKANDVSGSVSGWNSVAMDAVGNFVACWTDRRTGNSDIFAQRYDAAGNPLGANFKVNDDAGTATQYTSRVATDHIGNFVIAWTDLRNGSSDYDVYAQRYDAAGNPLGVNFRVNDDAAGSLNIGPAIAFDRAGNFVISWHDSRVSSAGDIYAQRFDATGHPQGTNFRVDEAPSGYQMWSAVALDSAGNFVICWWDWRDSPNTDIYARMFDPTGNPVGSEFTVNDDAGLAEQEKPSVAMDPQGDRFVIVWTDSRDLDLDTEIRAQFYENGSPFGVNVQINEPDPFPYDHQLTEWGGFPIACNHDTVLFAWMDNRRHKGWDIYATLKDWSFPGVAESDKSQISGYGLRAYPNPFRSSILITGAQSELGIYDISGRYIGQTENGMWDGTDMHGREVESGVYFLMSISSSQKTLKVIKVR